MSTFHTSHDTKVRVIVCPIMGLKTKEISEQTSLKPRSIRSILSKFRHQGSHDIPEDKKPPGNTKRLSERELAILWCKAKLYLTYSTRKICENNKHAFGHMSFRS